MKKSNPFPALTESTIRSRASQQSFVRGREYFEHGSVFALTWRDGQLTAEVQGSDYDPYIVRVDFSGDEIAYTDCSCPYEWGGDCKHIIAALLKLAHSPETIEQRPPLSDLLAPLDRDQLASLILNLAADLPAILDPLERLVARMGLQDKAPPSGSQSKPPVDINLLRRQIKAELRASIQTGYDAWGEERLYDSDLGAALEPALEQAQAQLENGDPRGALAVLEAAAAAWGDGIASLDEYFIDTFEDFAEEFTHPLAEMWTEALLSADLDPDERDYWLLVLAEHIESLYGGGSLEMALTAVEHGWDYPALVAAMEGNITEKGAWEGEIPDYADFLADIRLRILDRRGQHEAYLNLAQAEGKFMQYLYMLVRLKQVGRVLEEALETQFYPEEIHALARTMVEQGFVAEAFSLAEHGLGAESNRGKAGLAAWLRDQAQSAQRYNLALKAAQNALQLSPSLENYKALKKISGDRWEQLKPAALALATTSESFKDRVDVYLFEQMYQQAIETVDGSHWFYDIEPVIEAVKEAHPDWAFEQCSNRANEIMDAGRAKDYNLAADWLRRGRDILVNAGMLTRWEAHLAGLLKTHRKKYKLVPMLEKLQEK